MHRNYIGIISSRGLEALYPESEAVVQRLQWQTMNQDDDPSICYWFDMDEQAAQELERHLRRGLKQDALRALQFHVRFGGPMLPTIDSRAGPSHVSDDSVHN